MKLFRFLICGFILTSCSGPRAVYDYDQQLDYSLYNTYEIYPELRTGLNELSERRLLNALKEVMQEENLGLSEDPDLYLNVYSEEFLEPSRNTLGIGVGGGGGNLGVGVSGGIPIGGPENYLQLTFDLVDARNDQLVWQAVVESPFDFDWVPERKAEVLKKMTVRAFKGYPPRKN